MKTPRFFLNQKIKEALLKFYPDTPLPGGNLVKPCGKPQHGDFQASVALALGKVRKENPLKVAEALAELIDVGDVSEKIEISKPGFLNFRLKKNFCAKALQKIYQTERLGVEKTEEPKTLLFDFSSPNIAKEMHVGHIRSTILGDSLARIYRFLGHQVITDNHIGDWGTQFGKILVGYKRFGNVEKLKETPVAYLETLYQQVHEESKTDKALEDEARNELLKLQQGDEENLSLWKTFCQYTEEALKQMYGRLGIEFDHQLGESFYNPWLEETVQELLKRGIARESQGAVCVFFEGEKELEDKPMLIRKSDNAFLYATTDLATIAYRERKWKPDVISYVTDGRQQLHFCQLFLTAKRWGYENKFNHVWFGSILGKDKKPLKTREGRPLKLKELLDEAQTRALAILKEKRSEFSEEKHKTLATTIGIGALKYADLAQNRNLDYVFNWEKLLSFEGNTAPYLQNAYVRIQSIFRRAGKEIEHWDKDLETPIFENPAEITLAKELLCFSDALEFSAQEYRPHYLCAYLFGLANMFHKFYEQCPVLKAEEKTKTSRLLLCKITAKTLEQGLDLLGIGVVEEM